MKLALETTSRPETYSAGAAPLHSSLYPRTYRASLPSRLRLGVLSLIFVGAGASGALYFSLHAHISDKTAALFLFALSTAFAVLGLYLLAEILTVRLTLRADAIELHSLRSHRTLLRNEIAGLRVRPTQYFSVYDLVPNSAGTKKLRLTMFFEKDAALDLWFSTLPDLDAQEHQESEAQLTQDTSLGATTEDRLARVLRARLISKVMTFASIGAAIWAWFYPSPYRTAIAALAALPLIAIFLMLTNPGLYQIEGRKQDARPSLAVAYIFPGAVLTLRAIQDIQLLTWAPMLKLTVASAFVLVALLASSDRQLRARRWPILIMFLLTPLYTYGALMEANALLDHAPAQAYAARVLSKRISSGKTSSYYLELEPWGPQARRSEVTVSRSLYNAAPIGTPVCLALRPGALHSPWYVVLLCHTE